MENIHYIYNIINLTVCELKTLRGKILLKFHFNKSHGNTCIKLSTLVVFLVSVFDIFNWVWALQHWSGTRFHIHLVLLRSWRNLKSKKTHKFYLLKFSNVWSFRKITKYICYHPICSSYIIYKLKFKKIKVDNSIYAFDQVI